MSKVVQNSDRVVTLAYDEKALEEEGAFEVIVIAVCDALFKVAQEVHYYIHY